MAHGLDVKFVNPFIDGTIKTLKIQCSLEAKPGKITLKGKDSPEMQIDIAGIIGITSDQFQGSISICFPERTFLAVMGKMLGETFESISKDIEDGAGELTNIIFGSAKQVLNENGYNIKKALPTVVSGLGIKLKSMSLGPSLILPFETEVGPFQIHIGLDNL